MQDKDFLLYTIQLAKKGGKSVRPNPQVGAVIVHNNRIIGEGYHQIYGGPHAEVNAFNSVKSEDQRLLKESTIYVSLEPCCHVGETPPCTDLIIRNKIPRVCIAEIDPSDKVNRKGILQLRNHGVEVVLLNLDTDITNAFKINNLVQRPFVQLKFAKSKDNYMGVVDKQVWLSNPKSSIYTHRLRGETDAILIGTNTAIIDNPKLTLRHYPGESPQRILLDKSGRVPQSHHLLSDDMPCLIFTEANRVFKNHLKTQIHIDFSDEHFLESLLKELYNRNIYHIMIEGGASLLKSFVKANLWDEAIVINTEKVLHNGIKAPNIHGRIREKYRLDEDQIFVIENHNFQNFN